MNSDRHTLYSNQLIYVLTIIAIVFGLSVQVATSTPPQLVVDRLPDEEIQFSFSSQADRLYTLEYRTDLISGEWSNWDDFADVPGTGETVSETFDLSVLLAQGRRYFRLRADSVSEFLGSGLLSRYEFTENSPTAQITHPLIEASDFELSSGSFIFGGAQASTWVGSGVPYAQGNSGWWETSPETAKSFSYQLTASHEQELRITNISFFVRATSAGPSVYSVLIDETLIHTENLPEDETLFFSIPLTENTWTTQSVIHIAGWTNGSRSTAGTGHFRIDDVTTYGLIRGAQPQGPAISVPVVEAPASDAITENTAVLGGTVNDDGGAEIFERGVLWSLEAGFSPEEEGTFVREFGEFGIGDFSVLATGLPEGTDIYFRAYAENAAGIGWSDEATFTTAADQILAFYSFTGDSPFAEAHRAAIAPSEMTISSGNSTFEWAGAADWQAFGAEEPYIQGRGSWNTNDPESARRFEFNLDAGAGWYMTVTGITFVARSTTQGPSAIGVAVNGEQVLSQNMPANETLLIHTAVTGISDTSSLNIWIQGWTNGTRQTSGGGDLRIDNILVTGSMSMDIETDVPVVHSPTHADIDEHTALLGGTIAEDGGSTIIERGVVWSTVDGFEAPHGGFVVSEIGSFALGSFSVPVWQLPPDTIVYYRAFASSVAGTDYSEQASFATSPLPHGLLSLYEFTGSIVTPHLFHPHVTSSHLIHNTGRPGLASLNPGSWTGSGVPYAQASGNLDSPTPENARHFVFAKEARPGTSFTITNIQFLARATAAGPSAISLSINDQVIDTFDLSGGNVTPFSIPVTGIDDQSLATIKIIGWDNGSRSTAGTGLLQIDDVLTQGTTHGSPSPTVTTGRRVRIASVNVEDGILDNFDALRSILHRLDADIVAFQELYNNQASQLAALANELGYPHWVISPDGAISDVQRVGYFSRFDADFEALLSPAGANEFTRPVMRGVFDVPDVEHPLILWAVHKKALNDDMAQFRRAIETQRIVAAIEAYRGEYPDHVHYAVLGDMNADRFTQRQGDEFDAAWFAANQSVLPAAYELGEDIVFPVQYYRFPDDRYVLTNTALQRVPMTHPGGHGIWSFLNDSFISRLDYVFVSEALTAMNPVGEIYYSRMDGPFPGLPKAGAPLPASTSLTSSDHLPVFVDLYLPTTIDPSSTAMDSTSSDDWLATELTLSPAGTTSALAGHDPEHGTDPIEAGLRTDIRLSTLPQETRLRIRPHSTGATELTFYAHSGFIYTLEFIAGLGHALDWQAVNDADQIFGQDEWVTVLDDTPGAAGEIRAYRLRMQAIAED